ncbi:MAG: hypothetical protein GQ476_03145 [Candidatus Aminicenantes bacterium]|nr:hypothetical protein [Candidatus Aminicenantes bacterium]
MSLVSLQEEKTKIRYIYDEMSGTGKRSKTCCKRIPPPLPDKETQKALREIMMSDAQTNDTPSLPDISFP